MQQEKPGDAVPAEVDISQYPHAQQLLQRCQDFFAEVENLYVAVESKNKAKEQQKQKAFTNHPLSPPARPAKRSKHT